MKKRIFTFVLSLCAVFSLAFFGMNLSPKTTASAYTKTTATYTISDTGTTLVVKDGSDLQIAEKATLSELINEILSVVQSDAVVEILFDNVSLETAEQITLSRSFVFSGSLEINNESTLFVIQNLEAATNKTYTFDNFNVTNKSTTLSDFNFLKVTGNGNTSITLFNSNFNLENTSTDTSHVINFISTNNTLLLKGEVTHDTTLLCNWKYGIDISTYQNTEDPVNPIDNFYTDDEGNALTTNTETLSISVPYNTNEDTIVSNIESFNISRFNIVPNKNFFNVSTLYSNEGISATAILSFTFDTNGASYNEPYTEPSTSFESTQKINYPAANSMSLANHSFDGFFGVITYNSTDYYFNQTDLESFINNAGADADIPIYFKTDLSEFSIDTSFSAFNYFSKNNENKLAEYSAVYMLAEHNQAPKFIAKWNIDTYTVTFDSNGGSTIDTPTTTYDFGSTVTPPTNPTRVGHTFDGWYTEADENSGTKINFDTFTVPATNTTLYAHWSVNTYTISFVTNSDTITSVPNLSYKYGETILPIEQLSETGKVFVGWFEFDGNIVSNTKFETGVAMPANNITLHAVWRVQRCTVNFNANGGSHISMYEVNYGTFITPPANPTRDGYKFADWYFNQTCTDDKLVTFTNGRYKVTSNITFYAKWIHDHFWFSIYENNGSEVTKSYISFGQKIEVQNTPTRANHIFAGWFTDEALTQKLKDTQTMPAEDFAIYAKWIAKPLPTIDESKQVYTTKNYSSEFVNKSNLRDFIIRYYVDDEWVITPPTKVGSYDVMISRNEDSTYASYNKIIEDAFVIEPVQKNLAWAIVILFIVAALEFAVAIFIRFMRKMKFNMIVSIAIPLGSTFISSSQVVLLVVASISAVAGLVTMIYQLVKLHRTLPIALFESQNEENTQEKMMNHTNKVIEEVQTYSESDIEEMLKHDSVGAAIREKHKLDEKDFSEFEKEKQPIAPVETVEDDDDDDGDLKAVVEIIEDEYIPNANDMEKLYNSDDPFVRKDPNDYSNSNTDEEF